MIYLLHLAGNQAKGARNSHYLASSPMLSYSHMYFLVCSFFLFFFSPTGMTALKQLTISFPEIKTPREILVLDLSFLN